MDTRQQILDFISVLNEPALKKCVLLGIRFATKDKETIYIINEIYDEVSGNLKTE